MEFGASAFAALSTPLRRTIFAACGKNWWNEWDSNPRLPLARRWLSLLSYHPIDLKTGARSWFRANLSAFSARRCHQISFPSKGPPLRRRAPHYGGQP